MDKLGDSIVKCWRCGKDNVENISQCIYCGTRLQRSEPTTEIGKALRQLYDHYGCETLLTNPLLMFNGVGDLVQDCSKFRTQLRVALDAGIGKIYLEQIHSHAKADALFEEKIKRILLEDAELSDSAITKIMDAFDEMIGWEKINRSPEPQVKHQPEVSREISASKANLKRSKTPWVIVVLIVLAVCVFLILNQNAGWIPVPWATAVPSVEPEITPIVDTSTIAPEDISSPVPEDTPIPIPEETEIPTPEETEIPTPDVTAEPVPEITPIQIRDISEMESFAVGDVLLYGVAHGEKIKWIITDVSEESDNKLKVTMITQDITAYKLFNSRYEKTSWEQSSLRAWLNSAYCSYFAYEQYQPELTKINTSVNTTKDQVWILSEREYNKLSADVKNQFAEAIINPDVDLYNQEPTMNFWLRDSGTSESRAKYVSANGEVLQEEVDQQLAIRPVITLKIPANK